MHQCGPPASSLLKLAKPRICNWFPSPVAPQKACHHYCRAEERGGRVRFPKMICPQWARPARRTEGNGEERRGISKRPVFLFSSCKCAVILQPRRKSLGRVVGGTRVEGCITVLSWNKDFLSCSDKAVGLCLQIKIISSVEVGATNRHSSSARLLYCKVLYCPSSRPNIV